MIVRSKSLVLVCGLGVGFAVGCNTGGGGGGAVDAYVNKLKSCGLLTDGELPMIDDSEIDQYANCLANCFVNASCEDLETYICDPFTPNPEQLVACVDNCELEGGEGEDGFVCGDGEMIPGNWECDGFDDCEDGSDEVDCPELECADGSGTYLEGERCDGFAHCTDGSDELDCPGYSQCADGNGSIPDVWVCDGEPDCSDGSDEQGCPSYACANGEMAIGGARCDFYQDCEDGSDEQGCAQIVCPAP